MKNPSRSLTSTSAPSWFSLLASSVLGVSLAAMTPTRIQAPDAKLSKGPLRLMVQAYGRDTPADRLSPRARAISYAQRSVTADELRRGVRVDLVHLSEQQTSCDGAHVIAWVEAGEPDLEWDGRKARPGSDSLIGRGQIQDDGLVHIVLENAAG